MLIYKACVGINYYVFSNQWKLVTNWSNMIHKSGSLIIGLNLCLHDCLLHHQFLTILIWVSSIPGHVLNAKIMQFILFPSTQEDVHDNKPFQFNYVRAIEELARYLRFWQNMQSQIVSHSHECANFRLNKQDKTTVLDIWIESSIRGLSLISPCSWLLATLLPSPHAR